MHSPKLHRNLISGPHVDLTSGLFEGKNGKINLYDKNSNYVFHAKLKNGLYVLFPKVLKNVNFKSNGVRVQNLKLKTKPVLILFVTFLRVHPLFHILTLILLMSGIRSLVKQAKTRYED